MRTLYLAVAFALGPVLAGCSKPEPAAGAPSPDVVADTTTPTADSTVNAVKDSATTVMPDSATKP